MIDAAFEKLVAPDRSMALEVFGVPSTETVNTPLSACSCSSVIEAIEPPRTYAATAAVGYCENSRFPGLRVELSKPLK